MKNKFSFTLVELILYVAIVSVVLTFLGLFVFNLQRNIADVQNTEEAQIELLFVTERLAREIQNSQGIDSVNSELGVDPSRLALINENGGTDIIELSPEGAIRKVPAIGGDAEVLTSPETPITSLVFTSESREKRPGIIHIRLASGNLDAAFETAVSFRRHIEIN